MSGLAVPTQAERLEIIAMLDRIDSRFTITDVLNDYTHYVVWAAVDFPDDETPSFSDWLTASGWMDE